MREQDTRNRLTKVMTTAWEKKMVRRLEEAKPVARVEGKQTRRAEMSEL